jgi:hypothetical protein
VRYDKITDTVFRVKSILSLSLDELVTSHPNRWLCKEAKFKARALTATRRAGGLDFRPMAEKTRAL